MTFFTQEYEPYTTFRTELGIVQKETVAAITMPRRDFIDVIEKTIDDGNYSERVREIVTETAARMDRFPVGTWINPTRGCGCIVGEAIVIAQPEMRARLMSDIGVSEALYQVYGSELATELDNFGADVDHDLLTHLDHYEHAMHDWNSLQLVSGRVELDRVILILDDEVDVDLAGDEVLEP